MRQGTTPIYTLNVHGYDLTDKTVYVAIKARGKLIVLTNDRLSIGYYNGVSAIVFTLSQEETLSFGTGQGEVQVRFIALDGTAKATDIKPITIERILQPSIISYNAESAGNDDYTDDPDLDYYDEGDGNG